MSENNPTKLWIPFQELDDLKNKLPLSSIDDSVASLLVTAILTNPGYLTRLRKTHVLVEVGYFREPEGEVTGAYGRISRKQRHSMYPNGAMFTTYDENDVKYHLGTRTVTQRDGKPRIEVPVSDICQDLDQFVLAAHKRYEFLGLKLTEREHHLLFYQPINASTYGK